MIPGTTLIVKKVFPILLIAFLLLVNNEKLFSQNHEIEFFEEPFSVDYEKVIARKINSGIDRFLTRYTSTIIAQRDTFWHRRFDSVLEYNKSIESNRNHLWDMLGIQKRVDEVHLVALGADNQQMVAETDLCRIYRVEWSVMEGLKAEGFLVVPKGRVNASAVVIPDADELPDGYVGFQSGSGTAIRLAEQGVKVLVPTLINRDTKYSGGDDLIPSKPWMSPKDKISRWTNETHREWIWRQGFIMGKHIVGMEVQKVLAAVEWFEKDATNNSQMEIGVMGYGEGGLVALYAAALDTRIDVAWVSGYFGPREKLWAEPIYRDIWGLLTEFGDAEVASMIVPRSLIIECSPFPRVKEPLPPKEGQRNDALPGELTTPSDKEVQAEVERLFHFFPEDSPVQPDVTLHAGVDHHGSIKVLEEFLAKLGNTHRTQQESSMTRYHIPDPVLRHKRVFDNMQEYIQDMIPTAAQKRYAFLKGDFTSPESWDKEMEPFREQFYKKLIGKIDHDLLPLNPRMRQIYDKPGWTGYEVVLDVWPGVHSWGILAVPKGLKPGEKRPAVVLQHGIGGLPTTSILVKSYHRVLPALANRGFVVFAPYNPYQFNIRKAHAIKANAFSVIIPQYEQILSFLQSNESVDSSRIGLLGKSWGGRTALRVPIVLKGFRLSICNAYFNDWLNKVVSKNYANSYFFENSLSIYNWNMGNTFTHAEMALMIAPRPFMVVAGYMDGVAAHEMVASEYEKVSRMYYLMGIPERTEIEFFEGGHEINGQGAFRFLHKYLDWPEPVNPAPDQEISK